MTIYNKKITKKVVETVINAQCNHCGAEAPAQKNGFMPVGWLEATNNLGDVGTQHEADVKHICPACIDKWEDIFHKFFAKKEKEDAK